MPLKVRDIDGNGNVQSSDLTISGEMSQNDFHGNGGFRDFYETVFEAKAVYAVDNSEYNRIKRDLAQWMSNPENVQGPYYIVEDWRQALVESESLGVTFVYPHDIERFSGDWTALFDFNEIHAMKNLKIDLLRIGQGFKPEGEYLSAVYENFQLMYKENHEKEFSKDSISASFKNKAFTGNDPDEQTFKESAELLLRSYKDTKLFHGDVRVSHLSLD